MPTPLEDLVNNFNAATVDPLWETVGGAEQTGGVARLPTTPGYSTFLTVSASDYTLEGSSIRVELVSVPDVGGGSTQAMIELASRSTTDGALQIGFQGDDADGATLRGVVVAEGPAFTNAFNIAYSSTDHRWLRMSETGGTVTWATSPNGTTDWTDRGTVLVSALDFSISDVGVEIFSGHFAAETNLDPDFARFDNLNVTAAAPPEPISVSDYAGRIYAVEVRSSSGGDVVAAADFTTALAGVASVTGSASETWSLEGTAEVVPFGPPWVDVSTRVTHASWGDGRDDELEPFGSGEGSLSMTNDDRALDPEHTGGPWFGSLLPRIPFRIRIPNTGSVLDLATNASTGNGGYAGVPSSSSLDLSSSDLDVRIEVTRDWALVDGMGVVLAARYLPAAGERSWWLALHRTRSLRLTWSTDGTSDGITSAQAFAPVPDALAQRGRLAVRATLEADNGFGVGEARFYVGPDISGPWTQLGGAVAGPDTTTIFDAPADLTVGAAEGGVPAFGGWRALTGRVHAFELRDGIDGDVLAAADFTTLDASTTSFTDAAGNAWTVTEGEGSAEVTADPEPVDMFYGLAEDGFTQVFSYPSKGDAEVSLVDILGVLHGTPLGKHAYEAEVLSDEPVAYWPMDESEGVSMGDRSGNGHHGVFNAGTVGDDVGLVAGSDNSLFVPHEGGHHARYRGEALPGQPPVTVEAWIRTSRNQEFLKTIAVIQRDFGTGVQLFLGIGATLGTFNSPNGELLFALFGSRIHGHLRIDDGRAHHVVATIAANDVLQLYVDGIRQNKTVLVDRPVAPWSGRLWTLGNVPTPGGSFGPEGHLGHLAVYDYALTAERIAVHHQAGRDAFLGERSGERLRRILRVAGVPDLLVDIARGETTVGAAAFDNESVGDHAAKVAVSEQGFLYVNHHRGGRVTFRDRYTRHLAARSATSQYDFTDADTDDALHYERGGLEITPNGVDGIVNVAEVTWRGGTEVVSDTTSVDAYGAQSRTLELDSPSARAARSAGGWMVLRYAEPRARVRSFALAPDGDERVLPAALGMRISDRISLARRPLEVGDETVSPLFVEGVGHEAGDGVSWSTTVRTSSAQGMGNVWTWDDDGSAVWG